MSLTPDISQPESVSSDAIGDVRYEVDARGVCSITLDRVDGKANAFGQHVLRQMRDAFLRAGADPEVRVILLRSAKPTFCAGIDLDEMRDAMIIPDFAKRAEVNFAQCKGLSDMLAAMAGCRQPIIGVVAGRAVGSGVTVLTLCDLVVADAAKTELSYPEIKFGMMPSVSVPYLLDRMLAKEDGLKNARQCLVGADPFNAMTAKKWGVVDEVVPGARLQDAASRAVMLALEKGAAMKRAHSHPPAYRAPALDELNHPDAEATIRHVIPHLRGEDGKDEETFRTECIREWTEARCRPETLGKLDEYIRWVQNRSQQQQRR